MSYCGKNGIFVKKVSMEIICSFLVIAALVAMIVGLINPSLIMRWSKKPTRLKVFAWWFLVNFLLLLLLSLSLPEPTSQELVNYAKRNIEEGNYSSALYDLRKIEQTDSLYKEALALISKVDSLMILQTKSQERKIEKERLFADSMKQVLKKRVETEKLKFDVNFDDFENKTWIHSKKQPRYANTLGFFTYIGMNDSGQFWRRLVVRYHGDEWLFLKSIIIKTDTGTYQFDASNSKNDHNADVWEWIDIPVNTYESYMLKDIISSKQTKIRFNGSQYHYDWTLSSNVIQGLKEIDDYYYLMDSLQKIDR